jgi:hypothetical protein
MKKLKLLMLTIFSGLILAMVPLSQQALAACGNPSFLGIPPWYAYLNDNGKSGTDCTPVVNQPQDILLIGLAILDILMRVAAILAVIFIIIGGIKYTTSQGSPDGTKNAKDTIVNALIGLGITIVASGVISFIARAIGK